MDIPLPSRMLVEVRKSTGSYQSRLWKCLWKYLTRVPRRLTEAGVWIRERRCVLSGHHKGCPGQSCPERTRKLSEKARGASRKQSCKVFNQSPKRSKNGAVGKFSQGPKEPTIVPLNKELACQCLPHQRLLTGHLRLRCFALLFHPSHPDPGETRQAEKGGGGEGEKGKEQITPPSALLILGQA